jgi:hypothetical protein
MNAPRSLFIAGLSVAVVLVTALPAVAADLDASLFSKAKRLGEASLTQDRRGGGYSLTACDTAKDGSGVTAYAWSDQVGVPVSASDLDGANKGCTVRHVGLQGRRIFLKVCRRDRDRNVDKNGLEVCSRIRTTTA